MHCVSDIVATRLYARNRDVDDENTRQLLQLQPPNFTFHALDDVFVVSRQLARTR